MTCSYILIKLLEQELRDEATLSMPRLFVPFPVPRSSIEAKRFRQEAEAAQAKAHVLVTEAGAAQAKAHVFLTFSFDILRPKRETTQCVV